MDRVLFCDERNSEWKWHIIRRGWHWWSVRLVTPLMPRPHPRTPRCKSLMFFPSPWLHQVINYTEWSVISHRCFNGVRETGRLRALLKYNVYGWMWLYSFSNKSYILKNTILFGVFYCNAGLYASHARVCHNCIVIQWGWSYTVTESWQFWKTNCVFYQAFPSMILSALNSCNVTTLNMQKKLCFW